MICESGESAIPKRLRGKDRETVGERERKGSFLDIYTPLTHARGITLAMAAMFLLDLQPGHSNQQGPPLPILVPLSLSPSLFLTTLSSGTRLMMCHFLSLLVLCVRVLLKSDICAIQLNICAPEKNCEGYHKVL